MYSNVFFYAFFIKALRISKELFRLNMLFVYKYTVTGGTYEQV